MKYMFVESVVEINRYQLDLFKLIALVLYCLLTMFFYVEAHGKILSLF